MLSNFLNFIYLTYIRRFLKYFLHKFTTLCEIQRLCYGLVGCERTLKIENSLELSQHPQIKHLIFNLNTIVEAQPINDDMFRTEITNRALNTVLLAKKINPKVHSTFSKPFASCIEMIWSYRALYQQVENLRTQQYDENEEDHEQKLIQLWDLCSSVPLESRVTKQWQDIGFQVILSEVSVRRNCFEQLFHCRVMILKLIFEEWDCLGWRIFCIFVEHTSELPGT